MSFLFIFVCTSVCVLSVCLLSVCVCVECVCVCALSVRVKREIGSACHSLGVLLVWLWALSSSDAAQQRSA